VISEVMPCRIFDSARLSASRFISDCPSMSMNPGATMWSRASMRRTAAAFERSPTATMRSPLIPMSARNQGAPVPSTMRPPAMTRSNPDGVSDRTAATASITPPAIIATRILFITRSSFGEG
jgi:hypothetical protein